MAYAGIICRENGRRGGGIMCMKLDELAGKRPSEILKEVTDCSIPIDLDMILEKLGVIKIATSFDDLEKTIGKKPGSISGLVISNEKDVGIYYKRDAELVKKRFTIAHELGHCCLHESLLRNNYIEMLCDDEEQILNSEEKEANDFASQLLIPEEQLRIIHSKLVLPSLNKLSEIFEVPKILMIQRLTELKMTYYDDEGGKLVPPCL